MLSIATCRVFFLTLPFWGIVACSGKKAPANDNPPGQKSPATLSSSCRALVNVSSGSEYHVIDVKIGKESEASAARGLVVRDGEETYALDVVEFSQTDRNSFGSIARDWSEVRIARLPGGKPEILLENAPDLALPEEGDGEFEASQDYSILGAFGPHLMMREVEEGFTGGAHGFDSSRYFALKLPDKEKASLDFLGGEVLQAFQKAVREEDENRKEGDEDANALDIPQNLSGVALRLESNTKGGLGLVLESTLVCCTWVENHNMIDFAVSLEKVPPGLSPYLKLSSEPKPMIEAPDGCGAIGFDGEELLVRQGPTGEPIAVEVAGLSSFSNILGVTWLKPGDTFSLSQLPDLQKGTREPSGKEQEKPFVELSDDEEYEIVSPFLSEGETAAHAVFRGNFGPSPNTILVITRLPAPEEVFSGFVLIPNDENGHDKLLLPPLGGAKAQEIAAILLDNLDSDPEREPVLVATYLSGVGPEGAVPFYDNVVLDWNGKEFVRLSALEEKIRGLKSAKEIRKALKK